MSEMDSSAIYEYSYDNTRERKKYSIKMDSDNSKRKKTSIIVSYPNRTELLALGKYRESYDDILMRLINYHKKLHSNLSVSK